MDLFKTPTGWAVLITGGALLLYLGTSRRLSNADIFRVGTNYDFRNAKDVTTSLIPQNNPYGNYVSHSKISKPNGQRRQ